MSRNLIARRAGVLAAATVAGVLTVAGPAMADVKVEPASAPQGSGQNVHFQFTNTAGCTVSRVKLLLPKDTPIAEVFPLSNENWAPDLTPLKLTTPLTSIHNGSPVTETASAVTWIAMKGHELAPGKADDLAVALGPLPTTSSMSFGLEQTCTDGKAGPAIPNVSLALTPALPGQESGHAGHGGTTTGTDDSSAEDAATFQALIDAQDDGPGFWTYAGWVVGLLALGGIAVLLLRGRRRSEPADEVAEDEAGEEKEPVAAGAPRVTSWSYQDGPE
ncbi:DUF1775 domain-containing protein [Actinoplanes sp. NPDC049265]|uniref:DUF1775 domain-containing protein n=1 Tax=Actinoplanes sp. NPDC049265 TaxID=3363902 RepID=UPI00371480CD